MSNSKSGQAGPFMIECRFQCACRAVGHPNESIINSSLLKAKTPYTQPEHDRLR